MFEIKEGKVYSYGSHVSGADANTFEVFNQNWGRDSNAVYFQCGKVEDIKRENIVVLDEYSAHDGLNVFQFGLMLEGCGIEGLKILFDSHVVSRNGAYFQRSKIKAADPLSFESLGVHHARDKTQVFYLHEVMDEVDYDSFRVLETRYAIDKNHVYCGNRILRTADRDSFVAVPDPVNNYYAYAKDRRQVFYENGVIPEADPKTFRVISGHYTADARQVFHFNEAIQGADPNTFQVLVDTSVNEVYIAIISLCADKNWVYYNQQVLQPYDPSFHYLGGCYYHFQSRVYYLGDEKPLDFVDINSFKVLSASRARDQYHIYFDRRYLPNCDPASFEILDAYWSRDANHIYLAGELMRELNASTFNAEDGGYWARDDKHVFLDGNLIDEADAASFEHIGGCYYKDCHQIFYYHRHYHVIEAVERADPHSFVCLDSDIFGRDDRYGFYDGAVIEGSHGPSFEMVEYAFSRDKNFYFHGASILCERTLGDLQRIRYHEAIVGSVLFEDDEQLLIDPASFTVINDDYSKDKNQVIYRGHIVIGADPESFNCANDLYSCDGAGVFCYNKKLDLDLSKTCFAQDCYAHDDKNLYFIDELVDGADIASLICLEGQYCKDKYKVFHRGKWIEGADADSFNYCNFSEARDKNYRYFMRQGELQREKRVDLPPLGSQ